MASNPSPRATRPDHAPAVHTSPTGGFARGERIELLRLSSPDVDDLEPGAQGTVTDWDPDTNLLTLDWDDTSVRFDLIIDPSAPDSPAHPDLFDAVRRLT